jgi:hypothetical protein
MNIFAKKLGGNAPEALPVAPIQLYQTCSYKEGFGYLRGIQEEVLNLWHSNREQRDVICKMNTGSGKTLTGLLMLYSKLVEKIGPCIYIVPDNQLLNQTIEMAGSYGIPICQFISPGVYPADFVNQKSILITTFRKLFNGKSIFIREKLQIGALLLDDAHKCVDIAREQTTIKLSRKHPISIELFKLFADSLKHQLPSAYHRIESGDPVLVMKVPYWTWMDNHDIIIQIINKYVAPISSDFDNKENIKFQWDLVSNNLLRYDCFIGGDTIELCPIHVPYHEISAFNEAKFRFILSATFEDDYDLIKDLGIAIDSIVQPIVPQNRNDLGKRLILAPSRFDPRLTEEVMRPFIALYPKNGYNTVVLVPSNAKAKVWEEVGATFVDKDNIDKAIEALKKSNGNFFVFSNRYDGVDLNNDLCRVLVIDGLPMFSSLQEQYNEIRLESLKAGKKVQIIEQGLGRSARSGSDFSVIYLMGSDLTNLLGYEANLEYFTPLTKAQLQLGLTLLDGEKSATPLQTIKETADFCLTQDPDWHKYSTQALLSVKFDGLNDNRKQKLKKADIEKRALEYFDKRQYREASRLVLEEIVKVTDDFKDKAWYYQFAAQLAYLGNTVDSNNLQVKACNITTRMFHPQFDHIYIQIKSKGVQGAQVKRVIEAFSRPQDITIAVEGIISGLQYNPNLDFKIFENNLAKLGKFLGFNVQMPDNELGVGPDNLWCMTDSHYLIMEAKSEAIHSEISKDNLSQLYMSEAWFIKLYPEMKYTLITLQKSNRKAANASLKDNTKVLDQTSLSLLHANVRRFTTALQGRETKGFTDAEISSLLVVHNLTSELFRQSYLKDIK